MSEEEASSEFDELSFGTYTNMDSFGCVNWRGVFCEFAEFADFCVWCAHRHIEQQPELYNMISSMIWEQHDLYQQMSHMACDVMRAGLPIRLQQHQQRLRQQQQQRQQQRQMFLQREQTRQEQTRQEQTQEQTRQQRQPRPQ